jgi:hypothetical protein
LLSLNFVFVVLTGVFGYYVNCTRQVLAIAVTVFEFSIMFLGNSDYLLTAVLSQSPPVIKII